MTSITRNLPFFIRDPAVAIIGEVRFDVRHAFCRLLTLQTEMLYETD